MKGRAPPFAVRNGWALFRASAFRTSFDPLVAAVETLARSDPDGFARHPKSKLLARIRQLIAEEIPADPAARVYELGKTLGPAGRHWRRAKFLGRFRLFFRFDSASRTIIYAWVNDENTLRKAGSRSDPYSVFARRLAGGDPPDRWDELLADAQAAELRSEHDRSP